MMELVEVTKLYQQGRRSVHAVRGVSLTVEPGEFVAIMGPSGSGKSTLMHLLGALDTPTTGKALFLGRDLAAMSDRERSLLRRGRIGFVFQFFNLLPTLTAAENVALPLLLAGRGRAVARKTALPALERIGLGDRTDHFPEELSGGEMQRVAVALGVAMLAATQALNRTMVEAGRQAASPLAGVADLQVSNGESGVRRELADKLADAQVPGIQGVRPLVVQRVLLPEFDNRPALLL